MAGHLPRRLDEGGDTHPESAFLSNEQPQLLGLAEVFGPEVHVVDPVGQTQQRHPLRRPPEARGNLVEADEAFD